MPESSDLPEFEQWLGDAHASIDGLAASLRTVANRIREREGRAAAEQFHTVARRLQSAETRRERLDTVLESASQFSIRRAVFEIRDGKLWLSETEGIPLTEAPAVASAVESRDVVVTVRSPGELSPAVIQALGGAGGNAYLFPLLSRRAVEAVLCIEPHPERFDAHAAELICALAGPWLEEQQAPPPPQPEPKAGTLVAITPLAAPPSKSGMPEWTDLPREEQAVHLRAQRFARTRVSEMLVHKRLHVQAGRASADLYRELREEIDAGRARFQRQFSMACPSMVDYFHLELVRTLARGDESSLGPEYPGPVR